jgi:hypothetical protein
MRRSSHRASETHIGCNFQAWPLLARVYVSVLDVCEPYLQGPAVHVLLHDAHVACTSITRPHVIRYRPYWLSGGWAIDWQPSLIPFGEPPNGTVNPAAGL